MSASPTPVAPVAATAVAATAVTTTASKAVRSGSRSALRSLNRVALRQHGLVTLAQVARAGLGEDVLARRLASGRWDQIRPGVYATGAGPATPAQAVLAVCLSGGPEVVASHMTAAELWGLEVSPAERAIHVLSPPAQRIRLDGVVGHRSTRLDPADVALRRRIPITGVARTIVDVSGALSTADTGRCIDDAVLRRLVTVDVVRACMARLAGSGRRSLRPVRSVLSLRLPDYDAGGSNIEVRVLRSVRNAGLPLPRQQHRTVVGGRRHRIDLAYPEARVAIELGGWAWHGDHRSLVAERPTAAALIADGWSVLRIPVDLPPAEIVVRVKAGLRALPADRS